MPRLILTLDGVTLRDLPLTRERTLIGRRPHNDLVIDNLAVSGEHAVVLTKPEGVFLEDLGSTNGTQLNGRPVQRAALRHQDRIDIGKYHIRFLDEVSPARFERTLVLPAGGSGLLVPEPHAAAGHSPISDDAGGSDLALAAVPAPARLRMTRGPGAGRDLPLVQARTTIGRAGGAQAAIEWHPPHYTVAHLEGSPPTQLNGVPLGEVPIALSNGDRLVLAEVEMVFRQP